MEEQILFFERTPSPFQKPFFELTPSPFHKLFSRTHLPNGVYFVFFFQLSNWTHTLFL